MQIHNKAGQLVNIGSIQPLSVDVNTGIAADVDGAVAAATGLRLCGYSCKESHTTAAAASFNIVDGSTGASGTAIINVELAANTSETVFLGESGIETSGAISIDWISGKADVQIFWKALEA